MQSRFPTRCLGDESSILNTSQSTISSFVATHSGGAVHYSMVGGMASRNLHSTKTRGDECNRLVTSLACEIGEWKVVREIIPLSKSFFILCLI